MLNCLQILLIDELITLTMFLVTFNILLTILWQFQNTVLNMLLCLYFQKDETGYQECIQSRSQIDQK